MKMYVEIVERSSKVVMERMEVKDKREARQVADGASINLDKAEFFVRVTEEE